MYKKVIKFLYSTGKIKSREIENKFEIKYREVQNIIREARRRGHLISSGSQGYWISTPQEALKKVKALKSRAFDLLETVGKMERSAVRKSHYRINI